MVHVPASFERLMSKLDWAFRRYGWARMSYDVPRLLQVAERLEIIGVSSESISQGSHRVGEQVPPHCVIRGKMRKETVWQ